MLDVERAQPALLAHGKGNEIADLDQLRLGEMRPQPRPEGIIGRQVPGDRLGVGERRLLLGVVMRRTLEIDQVAVVVLDDALRGRFDRALIAAELAADRARHVDAAELLDGVVGHAVLEHLAPRIGKGPEYGGHVGPHGLALRPGGAFTGTTFKFGPHRRVGDGGRINVADARLTHGHRLLALSAAVPADSRLRYDNPGAPQMVTAMLPHRDRLINAPTPSRPRLAPRSRVRIRFSWLRASLIV